MHYAPLGRFYPDSATKICVGDKVFVEGDIGFVEEIIEPGTQESVDRDLEETGGIAFSVWGRMVIPFGFDCEIRKLATEGLVDE